MKYTILILSLLTAMWGGQGEPPGGSGQVTTRAVIHFLPDDTLHLKAEPVQGLRYFSTGSADVLQGLRPQSVIVYPTSIETVVGTGRVLVPGQAASLQESVSPVTVTAVAPGVLYTQQAAHYGSTAAPGSNENTPFIVYANTPAPTTISTAAQYGTQPTSGIYQEGAKPLPPGFLYSTTPAPALPTTQSSLAQNVDLTYDSLTANSQNSYVTSSPIEGFRTPPPIKASTYGPPKPVHGPFVHFRRPSYHHFSPYHYRYGIPKRSTYSFYYPPKLPAHLKSRYPVPPAKPIQSSYDVPQQYVHGGYSGVTKAIFHPYPSISSYAPHHSYSVLGKSDSDISNDNGNNGYTVNKDASTQTDSNSYSTIMGSYGSGKNEYNNYNDASTQADNNGYSTIIESYDNESFENDKQSVDDYYTQQIDITDSAVKSPFVSPIVLYREIRPPVKYYQKPEIIDPKFYPYQQFDRSDNLDIASTTPDTTYEFDMLYSNSNRNNHLSNFEWVPINAPEDALPARSYEIPAPDLSVNKTINAEEDRRIYHTGGNKAPVTLMRGPRMFGAPQEDGEMFSDDYSEDDARETVTQQPYEDSSEEAVTMTVKE